MTQEYISGFSGDLILRMLVTQVGRGDFLQLVSDIYEC